MATKATTPTTARRATPAARRWLRRMARLDARGRHRVTRNGAPRGGTGALMQLTQPTRVEGYEAIRLRSASAHLDATFVPVAGMVGASLRDGGKELLSRGSGVHCYARGQTTMGIPLLHPWANRLAADEYRVNVTAVRLRGGSPLIGRDEHGLPIHGLLGGSPHWTLRQAVANGNGAWALSAHLDFAAHPELL